MVDLNGLELPKLFDLLNPLSDLMELFQRMQREDLGCASTAGDVTSELLAESPAPMSALLRARRPGIVAGLAALPMMVSAFGGGISIDLQTSDGTEVSAGAVVARLSGPARSMLTLERSLLNLLGRLSGVATLTAHYVRAVRGTRARICDTRKTTPGLRMLEKYAVRCGGGTCHRLGLWDAVLLKDNHLAALRHHDLTRWLNEHLSQLRAHRTLRFVEVEVDNFAQFESVLGCNPGLIDIILLDNMDAELMGRCVRRRDEERSASLLEASGGVTLETVRAVAETGVDRISVGALTHSAPVLDLGLDAE